MFETRQFNRQHFRKNYGNMLIDEIKPPHTLLEVLWHKQHNGFKPHNTFQSLQAPQSPVGLQQRYNKMIILAVVTESKRTLEGILKSLFYYSIVSQSFFTATVRYIIYYALFFFVSFVMTCSGCDGILHTKNHLRKSFFSGQ